MRDLSSIASSACKDGRRSTGDVWKRSSGGGSSDSEGRDDTSANWLSRDSAGEMAASVGSASRSKGSAAETSGVSPRDRADVRSMAARELSSGWSAWLSVDNEGSGLSSSSSVPQEKTMSLVSLPRCENLQDTTVEAFGMFYLPIPEMSQSFSSCIARAVLVMSMDEMDRSSLSATSEASGVAAATSESEKTC